MSKIFSFNPRKGVWKTSLSLVHIRTPANCGGPCVYSDNQEAGGWQELGNSGSHSSSVILGPSWGSHDGAPPCFLQALTFCIWTVSSQEYFWCFICTQFQIGVKFWGPVIRKCSHCQALYLGKTDFCQSMMGCPHKLTGCCLLVSSRTGDPRLCKCLLCHEQPSELWLHFTQKELSGGAGEAA